MDKSQKKEIKNVAKKAAKKQAKKKIKKYASLNHCAVGESAYLKTILDPVNYPGVKIPDEITVPTFVVQVLTKFIVTTATGTGGNTGAGFYRTLGSTTTGAGSGYATLAPSATAQQYTPTGSSTPWSTTLVAQAAACRLVSAKATMSYLGSPNNAQGRVLMGFIPPMAPLQSQTSAGTFSAVALSGVGVGQNLLQLPNLVDVPAAKLYGEVRYLPSDDISRVYEVSGSLAVGTQRPSNHVTYGAFVGIMDGAVVSQSIEVNIWENYEVQPITSLVNIVQPTPSLSDPMEMAVASNVASSVPGLTGMQTLRDQQAGTSQQVITGNKATGTMAVHSAAGPSFIDKVFGGLNMAIDTGMKALPLASAVAAML